MIYHRGMAEELGISEAQLGKMTIAELCRAYRKRGIRLEPRESGVGPGLTLRALEEREVAQRREG